MKFIDEHFINELLTENSEAVCYGCELYETFCEGARCENAAVEFLEQENGRDYWRALIYKHCGNWFNNLSHRRKISYLKTLK